MKIAIPSFNRNILRSIQKIGIICLALCAFAGYLGISGTNAFFSDEKTISGVSFSAGVWIPEVSMSVNPQNPDGEDGWYETKPCVTLSATLDSEIFYSLNGSEKAYTGTCVEVPDGQWDFSAWAVNKENDAWKSAVVTRHFKVNTQVEAKPGDVVINEVMWMGSKDKPNDQWIELKNVSKKDVHTKDWKLRYKSNNGSEYDLYVIGDNRVIKKGEFLLLSYYTKNNSAIDVEPDKHDLNVFGYEKFQLKLLSDDGTLIDTAGNGSGKPQKGDESKYFSMERNDDPKDGSNYDNWHTCLDTASTALYWDSARTEQGTPGHANLSENYPTSNDSNGTGENIPAPISEEIAPLPAADETPVIESPGTPAEEISETETEENDTPTDQTDDAIVNPPKDSEKEDTPPAKEVTADDEDTPTAADLKDEKPAKDVPASNTPSDSKDEKKTSVSDENGKQTDSQVKIEKKPSDDGDADKDKNKDEEKKESKDGAEKDEPQTDITT